MQTFKADYGFKNTVIVNFINLTDREKNLVLEWRNHDNVRKWMYQEHKISGAEHQGYLKKLKNENKNICWLVKDKTTGYAGVISLNRIDYINKNAYIGIYSNPFPQVKGLGTILVECLKYIAFKKIKLHTLKLEVIDINERAKGFYEKQGFEVEGRLREFVYKRKKWADVVIMGIKG